MTATSSKPTPSNPAPGAAIRFQTRPPMKSAPAKSKGLTIAVAVVSGVAVLGLGAAGFFLARSASLGSENEVHRSAAVDLAKALNVSVDTNEILSGQSWEKVTAALTALRNEAERLRARVKELEPEVEEAARLRATLQTAESNARQAAIQVADLKKQLDDAQAASQKKIQELEKELGETKKALDRTRARIAELEAAAPVAVPQTGGEPVSEDTVAVQEPAPEPVAAPAAKDALSFTFPPNRRELLQSAAYLEASKTLIVTLVDGVEIRYSNVPKVAYDSLIASPVFETFYRIHILGRYPASIDDKAAVRELGRP